jgi:hypothetical protein
MPSPKAAMSSSATPAVPKLISGPEKEALEQAIQWRIAERAYSLFEASGRLNGDDLKHWLQAESEILQRGLEARIWELAGNKWMASGHGNRRCGDIFRTPPCLGESDKEHRGRKSEL